MAAADLLGDALSDSEREILIVYRGLKVLLERDDLPPCARANARIALAAIWQVVNDLDIAYEQIADYGV